MLDAHPLQIIVWILAGLAAFAALVGSASGVAFVLLRARFDEVYAKKADAQKDYLTRIQADDRYMTHEQFAKWADDHKQWGLGIIEGLKTATDMLNRTLETTNDRLDTLDTRLYNVLQRITEIPK